ncbi:ABC transporter substrate-binding protein [Paenibacillus elgii]
MDRSETKSNRKNKLLLPLLAVVLAWSAAGCSDKPAAAPPERGKLKVAYYSQELFDAQYGDYFMVKFPQFEVEVIATEETMDLGKNPQKEMDNLLDEQKPDLIIITDFWEYQRLAATGKLYELDSFIQQDKFDIENMLPAAIDYLRAKGGGKLYGLAPQFSSTVLFYNKGLFDQYKVPYPTEGMTWDALFELAGKFRGAKNGKDQIYGFHEPFMMSKFSMIQSMGWDMGLNVTDAKGRTVTIDTEAWQKVFSQITEAWKNGSMPVIGGKDNKGGRDKEDVDSGLFSQGRAAMTISGPWQIDRLQQSGSKIDWQIVRPPSPDGSSSWQQGFSLHPVFAIGAETDQADKAWKVVRYFNSPEAAKVETKTSKELITRLGFVKTVDGRSMEPFYQVKYDDTLGGGMEFNPKTPARFNWEFDKQADEQLELIMAGRTTVRQALQQLQKQGQQTLDAAWLAEPPEPEEGGGAAK